MFECCLVAAELRSSVYAIAKQKAAACCWLRNQHQQQQQTPEQQVAVPRVGGA